MSAACWWQRLNSGCMRRLPASSASYSLCRWPNPGWEAIYCEWQLFLIAGTPFLGRGWRPNGPNDSQGFSGLAARSDNARQADGPGTADARNFGGVCWARWAQPVHHFRSLISAKTLISLPILCDECSSGRNFEIVASKAAAGEICQRGSEAVGNLPTMK